MKRLQTTTIALLCASLLAACSKEESKGDAAVANGLCTQRTIDLMNQIPNKMREYRRGQKASDLELVDQSCQELKNTLRDRSCKAVDQNQAGAEVTVSYSDNAAICEEAAELLRPTGIDDPTNERPQGPNPGRGPGDLPGSDRPQTSNLELGKVGTKLSASVVDINKAEKLAQGSRGSQTSFAINGAIISQSQAGERIANGSVACGLHSEAPIKRGIQRSSTATGEKDRSVHSAYVAFKDYILICFKTNTAPTVNDAKKALTGIIDLQLN